MSFRGELLVVTDGNAATTAAFGHVHNRNSPSPMPPTSTKTSIVSKPKGFHDLYSPLSEILGTGAYARVELFRRISDSKEVAVKIVEGYGNERCRQKTFKEIEIYSELSGHPHIIDLEAYFEEDGRFYLVFPKMSNSLFETIVQRGRLLEIEAANVIRQIASGLAYLHSKGIAHRDIKPENILCARTGHLDPVKICDFDLGSSVKLVRNQNCTTPTLLTPVGSAEFMAPEVVNAWLCDSASTYDKKCDLWSLGVITYVLLCGYAPFNGNCGDSSCGWRDLGKYCNNCQMDLFFKIQSCSFEFPDSEGWTLVSDEAKDFVRLLLVRDAKVRPSAVELLNNPWLLKPVNSLPEDNDRTGAPLLATPSTLKISNALSFLLEQSNDAYRRASMAEFSDSLLPTFSPMPTASFQLGGGSSDDDDAEDDEDSSHYMDEQLLATTPRAGMGNFEKLEKYVSERVSELAKNSTWTQDLIDAENDQQTSSLAENEFASNSLGFLVSSDVENNASPTL